MPGIFVRERVPWPRGADLALGDGRTRGRRRLPLLAAARARFRGRPEARFAELATAIDVSFGRWDLSHQWQFELQGHIYVAPTDPEWESVEDDRILPETSRLSRLTVGDVFVYQFDAGDPWLHLCRVGETRIDPLEELGEHPPEPTAYDGWGVLPDQYLRRFAEDDGETPMPVDQRNRTSAAAAVVGA